MNTADMCAEGRELYAEMVKWIGRCGWHGYIKDEQQRIWASQAYRQHVDVECDICKQAESE